MCGPLVSILGLAGAVVQGIGAAQQAKAQAAGYRDQAAIHSRQARLEAMKGSYEAARLTEEGDRILGAQVAGFGASGFSVGGSIAEVVRETGKAAALDVGATRFGSRVNAENERILARANMNNADASGAVAPLAFAAPVISGTATFIRGMYA